MGMINGTRKKGEAGRDYIEKRSNRESARETEWANNNRKNPEKMGKLRYSAQSKRIGNGLLPSVASSHFSLFYSVSFPVGDEHLICNLLFDSPAISTQRAIVAES